MCMSIMFLRNFMYRVYTESKSKSKVWENDCHFPSFFSGNFLRSCKQAFDSNGTSGNGWSALELLAIWLC